MRKMHGMATTKCARYILLEKDMDYREKSFDLARDTSRLITTLSTAVIAFTVTFAKEIGGLPPSSTLEAIILLLSWASLLLSTVCGILTQLAITQVLDSAIGKEDRQISVWDIKIKIPFRWQWVAFLIGIAAIAVYGFLRMLLT
jgi:hypothetical protein